MSIDRDYVEHAERDAAVLTYVGWSRWTQTDVDRANTLRIFLEIAGSRCSHVLYTHYRLYDILRSTPENEDKVDKARSFMFTKISNCTGWERVCLNGYRSPDCVSKYSRELAVYVLPAVFCPDWFCKNDRPGESYDESECAGNNECVVCLKHAIVARMYDFVGGRNSGDVVDTAASAVVEARALVQPYEWEVYS